MKEKLKLFFRKLTEVTDKTAEFSYDEIKGHRFSAALAALPFFFWLPLARNDNSKFVLFHANNGAILLLASAASLILTYIFGFIPLGWLLSLCIWAFLAVQAVFSSLDALSGGARDLMLLGKLRLDLITLFQHLKSK